MNHPTRIEYAAFAEMVDLLERAYGKRFTALMDTFMQNCRRLRDQLTGSPRSLEDWGQG